MRRCRVKHNVFLSAIVAVAAALLMLVSGLVPGEAGSSSLAPSSSELTEVGRIEGGPAYHAIHANDEFVYGLVYVDGWLEIVDASDPANPFVHRSLDLSFGYGHDLWYGEWGAHKYVFTGHRSGGVTMVDVSDPDAPTVVSTAPTIYHHRGLQSVGRYLYYSEHPVGSMQGGLRIYDFDEGRLTEVGNWLRGEPCQHDGRDLAVRSDGNGLYQYDTLSIWGDQCEGPNEKVLFYDTTDENAPSLAGFFPPSGPYTSGDIDMVLSPDDRYLYLAHGESGVLIYDVSISNTLTLIATVGEDLYEVALDPEEGVLYASSGPSAGDSLLVVDVRDPAVPTVLQTVTLRWARDLWVDGDYLYVTTEEAKLIIYGAVSPPHKIYLPLVMKVHCGCGPDNYEPNDSCGQAYHLEEPGQTYQSYISCCDAATYKESDYFYINISTTNSINIYLTNIPAGTDYDLYLYRNPGDDPTNPAAKSDGYGSSETISYAPTATGTYYIRVHAFSGYSASPYSLRVTYD